MVLHDTSLKPSPKNICLIAPLPPISLFRLPPAPPPFRRRRRRSAVAAAVSAVAVAAVACFSPPATRSRPRRPKLPPPPPMENPGKRIDTQNLLSLGLDLVGVLRNNKDDDTLAQCKEGERGLLSSCQDDALEVHRLIQDYQKKINACKDKLEKVKGETVEDAEFERLQSELEEKVQTERLLQEELRAVSHELDLLEGQRISCEERKKLVEEREKDVLRAEDLLSMCASVTNIIPNFDDETKISGFIVDKKRNRAEKFELSPALSCLEACDMLWSMADL